jgi:cell division protein FtsW (lipid II flippase)
MKTRLYKKDFSWKIFAIVLCLMIIGMAKVYAQNYGLQKPQDAATLPKRWVKRPKWCLRQS